MEICGCLTAISHGMRISGNEVVVLEVDSAAGAVHVFFRTLPAPPRWLEGLCLGTVYRFTRLCKTALRQGEDKVEVYTSMKDSDVIQDTDFEAASRKSSSSNGLITFRGSVTAADSRLQLFQLDGDIQLRLTAIVSVTSCPQLETGDDVIVHQAHWDSSSRVLTACGRSRVQLLNRKAAGVVACGSTALHTFHMFILPTAAVDWCKAAWDRIKSAIGPALPLEGRQSLLHRLLQVSNLPAPRRRLTTEFTSSPHSCIVVAQFTPPFHVADLETLLKGARSSAAAAPSNSDGWQRGTVDCSQLVVGVAEYDVGARLVLRSGHSSAPLLLLRRPSAETPAAGTVLCLRKCELAWERFCSSPPQVYLRALWSDIVLSVETSPLLEMAVAAGERLPQLLLLLRSTPRCREAPGPFRCYLQGRLRQGAGARPVVVVVNGAGVPLCGPLRRGVCYVLDSADRTWTTRSGARCSSSDPVSRLFPDCTVLRAPDDIAFRACSGDADSDRVADLDRADVFSVSELGREPATAGQLVSVRGVVLDSYHIRDREVKYRGPRPHTLSDRRLVVRLGDCDDAGAAAEEVALYISQPALWASLRALLPGARLTARSVQWAGKHTPTYLVTTEVTELEVTDLGPPPPGAAVKRPRLHLPLRPLCAPLSSRGGRWLTVCCVADVRKVSLEAICPLCGHRTAAGVCGFVGCHGDRSAYITARASVVLDDGTAAVLVRLVGDSVRQLLAATDAQWTALSSQAERCGEIFHLQQRHTSARLTDLLSVVCQSATLRRPIVCELKRFDTKPGAGLAADGGAASDTLFCEAVMEASAAVMLRLFPDRGRAGPETGNTGLR